MTIRSNTRFGITHHTNAASMNEAIDRRAKKGPTSGKLLDPNPPFDPKGAQERAASIEKQRRAYINRWKWKYGGGKRNFQFVIFILGLLSVGTCWQSHVTNPERILEKHSTKKNDAGRDAAQTAFEEKQILEQAKDRQNLSAADKKRLELIEKKQKIQAELDKLKE
ncbi:MAG: hypothetical protein QE263_00185 [Vampirovibrionales bacterium]|nr:hypothetical protein [Vampirovibrionales bacterium]